MVPLYTVDQVAERLGKSKRAFQDWLRKHPTDQYGNPFYSPIGRTKTFDESDIARLRAATREEERCRLNSSSPAKARARTSRSGAHTSDATLTEALRLASERSPSRSSRGSSARSNVVSLPSPASRHSRRPQQRT